MRRWSTKFAAIVVAALGMSLVSAPGSEATVQADAGKRCSGSAVVRCVWMNVDYRSDGRTYLRAYGSVRDAAGGVDYGVNVQTVRLWYYSGTDSASRQLISVRENARGWEPTSETFPGHLRYHPGCNSYKDFVAETYVAWTGGGKTEGQWIQSSVVAARGTLC